MLAIQMKKVLKELQFYSPFRKNFFPKYAYNFNVPELCFLAQCIQDTKDIEGAVIEVGCHTGATTVFLNRLMDDIGLEKTYYALDTFSGFTAEDTEFEVAHRGKRNDYFAGAFEVNKKRWFDGTMQLNGINRVRSIETDVNNYPLASHGPYSFALIDVDLYKPMKKCLKEIYQAMSPNGIIVVDDCNENNMRWDGSDQAYKEFAAEIGQPIRIVHTKLGILRKV